MNKQELKKLLKRHTKLQTEANAIERQISSLLSEHCPDSVLLCELGCLSVTEPGEYEKQAYEELKEVLDND